MLFIFFPRLHLIPQQVLAHGLPFNLIPYYLTPDSARYPLLLILVQDLWHIPMVSSHPLPPQSLSFTQPINLPFFEASFFFPFSHSFSHFMMKVCMIFCHILRINTHKFRPMPRPTQSR